MRCAQIRPCAFLKKLGVLGRGSWGGDPPPGTHCKLHARSTMLHWGRSGGRAEPPPQGHMVECVLVLLCYMAVVWGGRSPPQGHSPNVVVICVCD